MAAGRSSDEGEAAGLSAEEMVLRSLGKGRSGWSEARGRDWKGESSARSTVRDLPSVLVLLEEPGEQIYSVAGLSTYSPGG